MCKHMLYVLILFPASSFSITGCPPLHGHLESHFLKVPKLHFKLMPWYFFKIIFIYYYFFLFSVIMPCFASHKRKKEREEKVKKERKIEFVQLRAEVSDFCSNKKQWRQCVMRVPCPFCFLMYFKWDFGRSIFSTRL